MKNGWMAPALLLVSCAVALAQTCPPNSTGCLVPGQPSTVNITCTTPTATLAEAVTPGTPTAACANVSSDTTCLLNQLMAIQSELRMTRGMLMASGLEMRGQMLINRMDTLIAQETAFRAEMEANPKMGGAHTQATALQARADVLDRDIAAYTRELSLLPSDARPLTAMQLSTFDQVYWGPAMDRLAAYNTNFRETACTMYQPAFAANPWLSPWVTTYSAALSTMNANRQVYASARWWTTMQVLGSTEVYPNMANVPAGSTVYYVPAGSVVVLPPGATISTLKATNTTVSTTNCATTTTTNTCPPQATGTTNTCPPATEGCPAQ